MQRKNFLKLFRKFFSLAIIVGFMPSQISFADQAEEAKSFDEKMGQIGEDAGVKIKAENSKPKESQVLGPEAMTIGTVQDYINRLNAAYRKLETAKKGLETIHRLAPSFVRRTINSYNSIMARVNKQLAVTKNALNSMEKLKTKLNQEKAAAQAKKNAENKKKQEANKAKPLPLPTRYERLNYAARQQAVNKMLTFANSKLGRVGYSMFKRMGPDSYDCSSFVYFALIEGGFLPKGIRIGTTEDLFKLKGRVFEEINDYNDVQPGDIFIRGGEGTSLGANGHTGIFLKKDEIIHCNYGAGTVSINDMSSGLSKTLDRHKSRNERYFRPVCKAVR